MNSKEMDPRNVDVELGVGLANIKTQSLTNSHSIHQRVVAFSAISALPQIALIIIARQGMEESLCTCIARAFLVSIENVVLITLVDQRVDSFKKAKRQWLHITGSVVLAIVLVLVATLDYHFELNTGTRLSHLQVNRIIHISRRNGIIRADISSLLLSACVVAVHFFAACLSSVVMLDKNLLHQSQHFKLKLVELRPLLVSIIGIVVGLWDLAAPPVTRTVFLTFRAYLRSI